MEIVVDLNTLTLGEAEQIEELSGSPLAPFLNGAPMTMGMLRALAFVFHRKTDPTFTYDQTADLVLNEVTFTWADVVDPTDGMPPSGSP